MTVETIDTMQTQQIEDLQDDIEDLAAKVNLAVTDVNQITTKINTVITDITNLVTVLMGSGTPYAPSGTTDDDGILQRIDELYGAFWDHIHMPPFSESSQAFVSSHPPFNGSGVMPSHATPVPNSLVAISQSSVSGYTPTAVAATVTGSYTPEITKSAIVLKANPENRARQMARNNLNTVRGGGRGPI